MATSTGVVEEQNNWKGVLNEMLMKLAPTVVSTKAFNISYQHTVEKVGGISIFTATLSTTLYPEKVFTGTPSHKKILAEHSCAKLMLEAPDLPERIAKALADASISSNSGGSASHNTVSTGGNGAKSTLNNLVVKHFPNATLSTLLSYELIEMPGGGGFVCKLTLPSIYSAEENVVFQSDICRKKKEAEEASAALALKREDLEERLTSKNTHQTPTIREKRESSSKVGDAKCDSSNVVEDEITANAMDVEIDLDYNGTKLQEDFTQVDLFNHKSYLSKYLARQGLVSNDVNEDINYLTEKTSDGHFISTLCLPRIFPDQSFVGKPLESIEAAEDSVASIVIYRPDLEERINTVVATLNGTNDICHTNFAVNRDVKMELVKTTQTISCPNNHPLCDTESVFFRKTHSCLDEYSLTLNPECRSSLINHQVYIQTQAAVLANDITNMDTQGDMERSEGFDSNSTPASHPTFPSSSPSKPGHQFASNANGNLVFCSICSTKVGKEVRSSNGEDIGQSLSHGNEDDSTLIEVDVDGVNIHGQPCNKFVIWGETSSWTTLAKFCPLFESIKREG